jgi:hypothetical protein
MSVRPSRYAHARTIPCENLAYPQGDDTDGTAELAYYDGDKKKGSVLVAAIMRLYLTEDPTYPGRFEGFAVETAHGELRVRTDTDDDRANWMAAIAAQTTRDLSGGPAGAAAATAEEEVADG